MNDPINSQTSHLSDSDREVGVVPLMKTKTNHIPDFGEVIEVQNQSDYHETNKKLGKTLNSEEKNSIDESPKKTNFSISPLRILFVYKFVKLFIEILKYRVYYRNYKNLKNFHLTIINDLCVWQESLLTASKKKKIISTSKSFFSQTKVLNILSRIIRKIKNLINRKYPVISCNNRFFLAWKFFIFIITFFLLIIIPLFYCYDVNDNKSTIFYEITSIIEKSVSFLFLADIIINLNHTFYENGSEIKNRKKIIIFYLKSTFIYDLTSILGVYLMYKNDSIFQILILFKIKSLSSYLNSIENFLLSNFLEGLVKILIQMTKILYVAHILSCIFNLLSNQLIKNGHYSNSWILENNLLNSDWIEKYTNAYYWAITTLTTVGYGDITPKNNIEKIFSIFVMLLGSGMFAYNLNKLSNIFNDISKDQTEYNANLKILNLMMRRKNLNSELQNKVRNYFHYINKTENKKQLEKENEIFLKLSEDLQKEIVLNSNAAILKQSKFFCNNFSEEFLQNIVFKMKSKLFSPDEIIFEDFDSNPCIFFIAQGKAKIMYNNKFEGKKEYPIYELKAGETIGELNLISNDENKLICKSNTFSSLYLISRNDFLKTLDRFPDDKEKFHMIKDSIMLYRNYDMLFKKCKLCNSSHHLTEKCNLVVYQLYNAKILGQYINQIQTSKNKERIKYLRSIGKKKFVYFGKSEETESLFSIIKSRKEIEKGVDTYYPLKSLEINEKYQSFSDPSDKTEKTEKDKPSERAEKSFKTYLKSLKNNLFIDTQFKVRREEESGSILDKISSFDENDSPLRKDNASKISKINKKIYKESEIFDFSFDQYKNFISYFPHNNLKSVLRKSNLSLSAIKSRQKRIGRNFVQTDKRKIFETSKRLFKANKEMLNWGGKKNL